MVLRARWLIQGGGGGRCFVLNVIFEGRYFIVRVLDYSIRCNRSIHCEAVKGCNVLATINMLVGGTIWGIVLHFVNRGLLPSGLYGACTPALEASQCIKEPFSRSPSGLFYSSLFCSII